MMLLKACRRNFLSLNWVEMKCRGRGREKVIKKVLALILAGGGGRLHPLTTSQREAFVYLSFQFK